MKKVWNCLLTVSTQHIALRCHTLLAEKYEKGQPLL